ncbi:MAG: type II secretion system F family protein, partial [Lachnospiraceae bacterium]|nr:type II secretion system F family protein [Lachnospiraceae bacterium]
DAMEWEQLLEVTLLPGDVSEDQMGEELREYLVQSERTTREGDYWQLPAHWKGRALNYHIVKSHMWPILGGLFIVASVMVFVFARKDLHQKYLDRQLELKEDYPELLYQLTLYLGAGLTIRGSLQKIGAAYEQSVASGEPVRAAFEEVGYVCRELTTGVSEIQAYENWSKRTGLAQYTQLCTLLIQNLQKGSMKLGERLREEGDHARREYIRLCKKKSEETQTKLLLPLVLMLVVVMLLILIPAFAMTGI